MPDEFASTETNSLGETSSSVNSSSQNTDQPHASISDLKAKIGDDISSASGAVKEGVNSAMDKVQDVASDQASMVARQVGGLANALKKVGAELEQGDQDSIGRYASQIGTSVEAYAKQIEGRDLGEIAGMAEEFGRKQPLAFLGVAAIAGLAASRFLTASARRSHTKPPINERTAGSSGSEGLATEVGVQRNG